MLPSPYCQQPVPVFVLVLLHAALGSPSCPHGLTYFDELTNRRECCYDICNNKDNDNLLKQCKEKCSDFFPTTSRPVALNCPPGGSYLNESTKQRMCCDDLCRNKETTEAEDLCRSNCPGYDSQIKKAHQNFDDNAPSSDGSTSAVTVVAVSLVALFLVAVVVTVVWFIRRRSRRNAGSNNSGNSHGGADLKEDEESLNGLVEEHGIGEAREAREAREPT